MYWQTSLYGTFTTLISFLEQLWQKSRIVHCHEYQCGWGANKKSLIFLFYVNIVIVPKIIPTYGWSHLVDSACSTDLESQKIANLLDILILQYRNADIKDCNSAEKMDDQSDNRFENSKEHTQYCHHP